MRISDWSSDVCSSDLNRQECRQHHDLGNRTLEQRHDETGKERRQQVDLQPGMPHPECAEQPGIDALFLADTDHLAGLRSEEHTSELQSLMRISYAVFCLKKKTKKNNDNTTHSRYARRRQYEIKQTNDSDP